MGFFLIIGDFFLLFFVRMMFLFLGKFLDNVTPDVFLAVRDYYTN